MLTPGEIAATQAALDAARAMVVAAEHEASIGRNIFGTLGGVFSTGPTFLDDDVSRSNIMAAASARDLYEAILNVRNRAIESPDDEHELALQVVEIGRRMAGSELDTSIRENSDAGSAPAIIAQGLRDTARQAEHFAKDVSEGFAPTIRWVAVGLAAVAAIFIMRGVGRVR